MPILNVSFPGAYRIDYFDPPSSSGGSREWRRLTMNKPDRVKSRKPKKWPLPPKPYFYTETVSRHPDEHIFLYKDGSLYGRQTGVWSIATPTDISPFFPQGEAVAINKALADLKGQKVNLGVGLAEAKKTAQFLGDGFHSIVKGYKRLRRLDPKGAARALGLTTKGDIPKKWLAYQYGLNPLLADMDGAVQELLGKDRAQWKITVKGQHEELSYSSYTSNEWGLSCTTDVVRTHRNAVSLSYAPNNAALIASARLGVLNPFAVAWEVTPFSLVLDWALPVGDFLNVMDATVGWEFLFGSHTSFVRCETRLVPSRETKGQSGYVYTCPSAHPVRGHGVRFERKIYAASPWPRFPPPKNPLSLGHMANGLSMLAAIFGR